MLKILKVLWISTVAFLILSTILPINFAQQIQEAAYKNCQDCRPTRVVYCSKPLDVEIKNGESVIYPSTEDDWTEKQYIIDNHDWIAYPAELRSDSKVGQKSFYGESTPGNFGLKFFLWYALNGKPLTLSIYDKLHFWFKSPDSGPFNVYFDAEDGAPWEIVCDLGDYKTEEGWKEYTIDITENCTWLTEKKPIMSIVFDLETNYGGTRGYIDGLYITSQPVIEDKQYYFTVDKNTNNNFDLKIKDISPMKTYESLEFLSGSGDVSADTDKKTIHVYDSTDFILHGDGSNLDMKKIENFPEPIYVIPTENCEELVSTILYSKLKTVTDYVEKQYGISLKSIKADASRLRIIYNSIMNSDGGKGFIDVGDSLKIFKVGKNQLTGDINLDVRGQGTFDSSLQIMGKWWGNELEGIGYYAVDKQTNDIVGLLDVSDMAERGEFSVTTLKLADITKINGKLASYGMYLIGDFVHSHPGGPFIPTRADVLRIGTYMQEGYPFTYARLTILDPTTGKYKIYLLDLDAVELEVINARSFSLSLVRFRSPEYPNGYTTDQIKSIIGEYTQQAASIETIVYELAPGQNSVSPQGNKILNVIRVDKYTQFLINDVSNPLNQLNDDYQTFLGKLVDQYGDSAVIPDSVWDEVLTEVGEFKFRTASIAPKLKLMYDIIDEDSILRPYMSKLTDSFINLNTKWDDLLELSGGTVDDIKMSPNLANELQTNLGNFRTALIQNKMQVQNDLPDLLKELKRMGVISNDPSLSKTLTENIENLKADADASIKFLDQDEIAKVQKYFKMTDQLKTIGTIVTITSVLGSTLFSTGLVMKDYGEYLDNVELIIWGNWLFYAGLGVEVLSSGISIAGLIAGYSLGLAAIAKSAIFFGFIKGQIIGLLLSVIFVAIINGIICWLNPDSPFCGCSSYPYAPYNGKPKLEITHNTVVKGDTLKFTTHGMQYCYSFRDLFGFGFLHEYRSNLYYSGYKSFGDNKKYCTFEDGTCCEGSVKVTSEKGEYDVSGRVGPHPMGPVTTFTSTNDVKLNVIDCNSDKTGEDELCHEGCGADEECGWKNNGNLGGFPDNAEPVWPSAGNMSANQIRSCEGCSYRVIYDSYLSEISVNGFVDNDASVKRDENIQVTVKVNNTGTDQQAWWFVGVEFYKVDDYTKVGSFGPRIDLSRIDAWYNGKDKTSGCSIDNCGCSYSDPNNNGILDPDEIITVTCWAPSSHWQTTSGNERIMFWVHERDLGQDALNDKDRDGDGIISDWWTDALAKSFRPNVDNPIDGGPASVRVKILGKCLDVNKDGAINILDLAQVAKAFGSKPTENTDRWNPNCDFDDNGAINILDISKIARVFGKTCSDNCCPVGE